MPREIEMNRISLILLASWIIVGCARPTTRTVSSQAPQEDGPDLSFETQMEVFYPERMGRSPDRYDYLWYACKAAVFAEEQTDPDLKQFARTKVEKYLRGWKSARMDYPPAYLKERIEGARLLPQRLHDILSNASGYSHKKEIDEAIQELETEMKQGITIGGTVRR
jgi:hypothetical protein